MKKNIESISVVKALELWTGKYPNDRVTAQTIRNWCKRFNLSLERGILRRSKIRVNIEKFNEFLNNPKQFLHDNVKG